MSSTHETALSDADQILAELGIRKPTKAERNTAYWAARLIAAETPDAALTDMWSWSRGGLAALDRQRAGRSDAARLHLARQLAVFTVKLPDAEIPLRPGLTHEELAALFHPWKAGR